MYFEPIITDPTDCDAYKFSMSNFLFKQGYLRERVGWRFFNRDGAKFPKGYAMALRQQVDSWADLRFTDEMLVHLEKALYWLDYFYLWAYLKTYKFDPSFIDITYKDMGDYEDVTVSYEGEWGRVIFFEIYLLATMSELYNKMSGMDKKIISEEAQFNRNKEKFIGIGNCGAKFAEFGTRRRYSKAVQEKVLKQIKEQIPASLQGTSNVMFARNLKLMPIGTLAHELVMFMGAKYGPVMANEVLMKKWVEVYNGALGIYLPDTYTTKHFLNYFDLLNSKLWDGVREDSAPNTDEYVDMIIDHYKKHRIDPSTKTINHSNGITGIEQIVHMQNYRFGEIRRNFGLGTWITNDVYPEGSGLKAVDWVVKLTHMYQDGNVKYCVKISDMFEKRSSIDEETTQRYLNELNLG